MEPTFSECFAFCSRAWIEKNEKFYPQAIEHAGKKNIQAEPRKKNKKKKGNVSDDDGDGAKKGSFRLFQEKK